MKKTTNFQELDVWKEAHEFVLSVYKYTESFPQSERYGLVSQFRRAAISIAANIAEGYVKFGLKDKVR
ncbi:MAG: four helix bundle protein, partial [Fidelibacterota bacterium]